MTRVATPALVRGPTTWRAPLFRSGHILVLNSAVTAGVGFAFWLVAARLYPPAVVGSNASAVSAMMFLAGLAQLNLMSLLLRFVPAAGRAAARLVARAYLLGAALSALAALGFVLGLSVWAPGLVHVLHGPTVAAFVLATAAWSVFVMQDNVLVGVRRPGMVAVENLVFAGLKLALLIPGAIWLATSGVWYAWAVATGVAVCGTTWFLFARAIPRFADRSPATETPSLRRFLGYLVPDYFGSLTWIAGTSLVPVLVLDLTDSRRAAAFALAWSIGFTLFAVPTAFGQSLVAHGAADPTDAEADHRRVRRHVLLLLTPVAAVLIVVAPELLSLFGPWYETAGTGTLRLVAAAAVPNVIVALAVSHARVTRRMRTVVIALTPLCVVVLGLTLWLVPRIGIAGAGWAWLAAETLVAAAVLLEPAVRANVFVRTTPGGRSVPAVRRTVAALAPEGWVVEGTCSTVSDTAVLFVRAADRPAVVKLSDSVPGALLLDRETRVLARLRAEEQLGAWRELLPERLRHVSDGESYYALDARLPGRPGIGRFAPSTDAVMSALAPLHRLGRHRAVLSEQLLHSWVEAPAAALRAALTTRGMSTASVARLMDELVPVLTGRSLELGWTHGDLHPGNVLVGADGRITGLIDWSQARDTDLDALDLALWLLTVRQRRGESLGRQVAHRLRSGVAWPAADQRCFAGAEQLPPRALLLLAWLRHVSGNLTKSERYRRSPLWLRRTVLPVLGALQR